MLDSDTKRRIDSARDILVGKVPDPKSQVEQITIALIYKFMDDMDAESEEFGGKRKFFAGANARYGWTKLMRSGLGGHETLNLYAEAIAKMPENRGIPLLFREIFKNAYLPYRDPETLRAFLKIIDEFTYDHSEKLGDAFEYLLSVLGSQGDAGQFRTPRHIIDFMVAIVDPKKNETVLDPACGTAGFLISSYKHILKANTDAKGHSTLSPDEKARLAKNFTGYDISPDMVRLSLVNLYLHGFADPHIHEYDTLTSLDRWKETADVILANPPFMTPKGGIRPHQRFSVPSNRCEVLFVDYMLEHLTAQGRAGIIVPEGIIFQSGAAYKRLREVLLREALIGVISLPSGVFQPYSGVKTSILVLDKQLARVRPTVLFSDIRAIGISLGIKRTITERNDLPFVLKDYLAYYQGSALSEHSFLVERDALLANDCILSAERYRSLEARVGSRVVKLKEVCSLTKGAYSSTKTKPGAYPLVVTAKDRLTSVDYQFEGDAVCVPLISSTGHGRASIGRIHFASGKFAVANLLAALRTRSEDVLDTKFLYFILDAQKKKMASLMKGAANVSMKLEDLAEFQIPLPSLEGQKEIVAEIEGYQKVISGARAVLNYYRPHIPVRPEWPMVELGDVAVLINGDRGSNYPSAKHRANAGIPFVNAGHLFDGDVSLEAMDYITRERFDMLGNGKFVRGDILYCLRGSLGKCALVQSVEFGAIASSLVIIRPTDRILTRFLYCCLTGRAGAELVAGNDTGSAQPNLSASNVKKYAIPLPPPSEQARIVAEIEAEQALVAANRELIRRFEKKIQATLARVWGDDVPVVKSDGEEAV